jgi:stalled ribosome rescue protein Dom34
LGAKKKPNINTTKKENHMSTFHAVVWMDHQEAHVLMFDREHVQNQRIKSRSHHKHQGKPNEVTHLYADIAKALEGTHEVLVTGPGLARDEFREWCKQHHAHVNVVDSVASDHPTDAQLVAMARHYFKKFDNMTADPALVK